MSDASRAAPKLILVALVAFGVGPERVSAQARSTCAAMVCDESAALVAALDSVLREAEARGFSSGAGPRILRTVHRSPFRQEGALSPPVDRVTAFDLALVRRRWPGYAVVDSSGVVSGPSGQLTAGGPLVILAPVTWMGADLVRVRFAVYFRRVDYGEEWFVLLRRTADGWRVVRVEPGIMN